MEKRYQVFISSTFADLEDERRKVMDAVLECGCYPAGMEMFPAMDMEQFTYIKSVIDKSDFYILILAGRYGSLAKDGISYTEKEYNYAVEKGIPTLVFIKRDIESIPPGKKETDLQSKEKLLTFRKRVAENRLLSYWDEPYELKSKILLSLPKAIKETPDNGKAPATPASTDVIPTDQRASELKGTMNYLSRNLDKKIIFSYIKGKTTCHINLSIIDIINYTGKQLLDGTTKKQFGQLLLKAYGFGDSYIKSCKIYDDDIDKVLQVLVEEKVIVNKPAYEPVIFTAKSKKVFLSGRQ